MVSIGSNSKLNLKANIHSHPTNSVFNILKRPLTRRQLLISLSLTIAPPLLLSSYGFGVETRKLKVESVRISFDNFSGLLRAVHLSDLHFHEQNVLTKKVVEKTNSLQPDCIFITGDLVDDDKHLQKCLNWIQELRCKYVKYFVPGNWEHWSGTLQNGLISKLDAKGVKTLYNSGEIIGMHGGNFFLTGIDDAYFGAPNPQKAFKNQRSGIPTIVLSHSPLGVNILKSFRTDLILSGHTHGGQVRLPGIGALQTPPGSGKYEMGLYRVGKCQLYVNRGIGTSIIPIRFMCPPELTLIEITGT